MSAYNPMYVIDASITVAWFFLDDPFHQAALEVQQRVMAYPNAFVIPTLLHSEFLHVLARKSNQDEPFVSAAFELLLGLGLRTVMLSERALRRAVSWTCKGMGGYDATYVALAEDLNCQWLTADKEAVRRVGDEQALHIAAWA